MSNMKINRIKHLVNEIRDITGKLNVNIGYLELPGELDKAKQILNDVEEVHHAAVMAGDIMYMQKLGTILERYKEVRKDEVGD